MFTRDDSILALRSSLCRLRMIVERPPARVRKGPLYCFEDQVCVQFVNASTTENATELVLVPRFALGDEIHGAVHNKSIEALLDEVLRHGEIRVVRGIAHYLGKIGFSNFPKPVADYNIDTLYAINREILNRVLDSGWVVVGHPDTSGSNYFSGVDSDQTISARKIENFVIRLKTDA